MSVYAIATITIHDLPRYALYGAGFMDIFNRFGGKLLSVDEAPEVLEGEWPHTRTVLIEFPTREAMTAWWQSPDYRALAEHRHAASVANIVLIQGLGG